MSSVLEAELSPASRVCQESGWQNSVLRHGGMIIVEMADLGLASGVCPVLEAEICPASGLCLMSSCLEAELCPESECPVCRVLSCVRGMSIVRLAKLCPASRVCPVSQWQNCALRVSCYEAELCPASRVCPVAWRLIFVLRPGYAQCRIGSTLSSIRGMSRVRVENSVLRQRYDHCSGGRTLSFVRDMSSVRMAEI
ncbi:hypothetical protein TNCV_1003431 [Trichonephila clavipes]|nr:hypothetical protein TNCV_1003431 [Trichonephila clavipes]